MDGPHHHLDIMIPLQVQKIQTTVENGGICGQHQNAACFHHKEENTSIFIQQR